MTNDDRKMLYYFAFNKKKIKKKAFSLSFDSSEFIKRRRQNSIIPHGEIKAYIELISVWLHTFHGYFKNIIICEYSNSPD